MPDLITETRDGVTWLTLNRPERHNALSPRAVCLLADAWERFRDDDSARVAIVTGSGERAFCAGADLGLLVPLMSGTRSPRDEWDERVAGDLRIVNRALLKGVELHKPVIAAVNGLAVGGGCELVLATDLRVAATTATFGLPEVRRGLVPAGGGMVRLPRQLPHAIAMELLLTGDAIDAATASRFGLVNRVVEPAQVHGVAMTLAARIAANGPLAVRTVKQIVFETDGVALDDAHRVEGRRAEVVRRSADAVEGARAFLEKRPPNFTGR